MREILIKVEMAIRIESTSNFGGSVIPSDMLLRDKAFSIMRFTSSQFSYGDLHMNSFSNPEVKSRHVKDQLNRKWSEKVENIASDALETSLLENYKRLATNFRMKLFSPLYGVR